ncbi:oxygenase MpaB family protein [Gordonia araii]|uniref:oxygenase MpaB family protein n=1 Tax=Gordonia araii TaxID=263909 RepID=UPI0005901A3C|nr:oxygenase MpaB family protein [Gordonia araii]
MTTNVSSVASSEKLGSSSLLWRWAGDMRIAFTGGTAGLLQTMDPAIGYALIDHSNFFADPVDRVFRSLPSILGTVYDDLASGTGVKVRDLHRDIKGTQPDGVRYHALNPTTFWWAHATFQVMVEQTVDRYSRYRLTDAEREQLYQEGCEWYRRYAMSEQPLPPNRAAFQQEWDRYCREVLTPNPASDYLMKVIEGRAVPDMSKSPHLPVSPLLKPVARLALPTLPMRAALAPPMRLTIYGGLPPEVRKRFGIRWNWADELAYRALLRAVPTAWPLIPVSWRWHPNSHSGWRRDRGRLPRPW